MYASVPKGSLLLLDACCLINLFATGRIHEILQALPFEVATSRLIVEREVISVSRLEGLGSLSILDLSNEKELSHFVEFAAQLDDGEASVWALAVMRRGAVATDDRKALRLLAQGRPSVPTIQTPELLYEWARMAKISAGETSQALLAIEERARFRPRRDAPRFDWWERLTARPTGVGDQGPIL